jgi:hypothetical protein
MTDWKKPLRHGPAIPAAPEHFQGSMREFVDRHLQYAIPAVEHTLAWHAAVCEHARRPSSRLLVRTTPDFKQEDLAANANGRLLVMTDNAPPWWIHATCFAGHRPPHTGIDTILDDVWCWMFRAHRGGKRFPGNANQAGWYVAHILQAKPRGDGAPESWDDRTAEQRFLRNVSPLNQFLVPKGNGRDVGERPAVISTIAAFHRERYGDVFEQFLVDAGARPGELGAAEWNSNVEMHSVKKKVGTGAKPPPPAKPTTPRAVSQPSHRSASSLWTMALRPAKPLPASLLMAEHPNAAEMTRLILDDGLTSARIVAITNAMYNPCRPANLKKKGLPVTAEQAWKILVARLGHPHSNQRSKWRPLVQALEPLPDSVRARIQRMSITDIGSLAAAIITGPYALMAAE